MGGIRLVGAGIQSSGAAPAGGLCIGSVSEAGTGERILGRVPAIGSLGEPDFAQSDQCAFLKGKGVS